MGNPIAWKSPALALALMLAAGTVPALAEASVDAGSPAVAITPMPDAALPGAYCLAGATAAMVAAFAAGPTESLMILSGAMHLPSGTAVLFIPLMSILGGGACAIAAAAQPAVSWAIEQSDNIAARFIGRSGAAAESDPPIVVPAGNAPAGAVRKNDAVATVRPLTEGETQSAGCVAGALAGFGAALATSPSEVAMLSSGANTIVSSTPILALGLLGTIVASGCVIGTYAILPFEAFFNSFGGTGGEGGGQAQALTTGASLATKLADDATAR